MNERLVLLALMLATTPACSLLANPSDHTGHTHDAGPHDAGRDGGSIDSAVDAFAGPADSGLDAYAPPECTTATDCGSAGAAGLVQCVASRCVFCATPSEAAPHELRHASALRPYVSIGIRRRPTGPALVVVGTMGSTSAEPALGHRAAIDAPSGAVDSPLGAAIDTSCPETFDSVSSIAFLPDDSSASSTTTSIAVIAEGPLGGMITHLTWADTTGAITPVGFTCRALDAPADFLPGAVMLAAPSSDGSLLPIYQITREAVDATSFRFVAYNFPYANQARTYTAFGGPTGPYAAMTAAGPFMLIGGISTDSVLWWDPETTSGGLSPVMTPGRTGDPSAVLEGTATMAGELLHFVMAYPVADLVRFVNVDCDSACIPVGEAVDVHTGAMAVTAARFGLVGDVPVLLTSEHLADGTERVVLRVLRANRTPYDAPGGGRALVLDAAAVGTVVSDVQLAVVTGTTARYAAVWMVTDASGTSSVRLQTFQGSCP